MLVSYIVPSYNHSSYVKAVLNSIYDDAKKNDFEWEIVVIDDGSSDESVNIIGEWLELNALNERVFFLNRKNKGLTFTLNELINKSKGKFVRLCSSDDLLIAGSTKLMVDAFIKDDGLLCVAADGLIIDDKGDLLFDSSIKYHRGNLKKLLNQGLVKTELIINWCLSGPCVLVKRQHYEYMQYENGLAIDDFDFFLSLLEKAGSIKFVDSKVCQYRLHDTNTSKAKNKSRRIVNLEAFYSIIDKYKKRDNNLYELRAVGFITKAKIHYLKNNFIRCAIYYGLSIFERLRISLYG